MASTLRPASRLVAGPYTASAILRQATDRSTSPFLRAAVTAAHFHSSSPRYALPSGPPPQGYRLPRPKRFDEGEHVLDKASNYFLLTEMFRGMYVVLEQFFRPPYVFHWIHLRRKLELEKTNKPFPTATRFSIPSKRAQSHQDSEASMR